MFRSPSNPIIKPDDIKPSQKNVEVIGVFNAGVARFEDEIVLLLRVAEKSVCDDPGIVLAGMYDPHEKEIVTISFQRNDPEIDISDPRLIKTSEGTYLTSISHFRLARSKDGIHFKIDQVPTIRPENEYETFGIEDPRISLIDNVFAIHYVGVSPLGVTTSLITTKDFNTFERRGVIFCPENKDVVLFPEKIGDTYYALHRPTSPLFRQQNVWIAESPDLLAWGHHRYLFGPRPGDWDVIKVGVGAVPIRTNDGWLEIYHGVDSNDRYCLGAVLLDHDEPWNVLARSSKPILEPETDYECHGFFGDVVFTCGILCENDTLKMYYGAADTTIAYAEMSLSGVLGNLMT